MNQGCGFPPREKARVNKVGLPAAAHTCMYGTSQRKPNNGGMATSEYCRAYGCLGASANVDRRSSCSVSAKPKRGEPWQQPSKQSSALRTLTYARLAAAIASHGPKLLMHSVSQSRSRILLEEAQPKAFMIDGCVRA